MKKDDISQMLSQAMKAGDRNRVKALRNVLSAVTTAEKADPNKPGDITAVLNTAKKQRTQSIEMYNASGREDLAAEESAELGVILELLPKQLTLQEMQSAMQDIIDETGDASMKWLMQEFKKRFPGQDGKLVADAAKSTSFKQE